MSATKEFYHHKIEKGQRAAIADTRDYPILFDTQMVQAILSGEKTQTSRSFKSPLCKAMERAAAIQFIGDNWVAINPKGLFYKKPIVCPYGKAGDLLWVKETWAPALGDFAYKADYDKTILSEEKNKGLWHPSIHMPKTAARIWLQITDIKAQRIQTVSEEDAREEGCRTGKIFGFSEIKQNTFREGFFAKWIAIYGIEKYHENIWVWSIKFKHVPFSK